MSKFRNVSGEERFAAFGTSPGAVAPDGVIDVLKEADENYDCLPGFGDGAVIPVSAVASPLLVYPLGLGQPDLWERVVDAKPVKNSEENK